MTGYIHHHSSRGGLGGGLLGSFAHGIAHGAGWAIGYRLIGSLSLGLVAILAVVGIGGWLILGRRRYR